jgi:hypothetical protein
MSLTHGMLYQCCGESSPHQSGNQCLDGWFDITIEPDAYLEYYWLVRSLSLQYIFLNVYITLILSSNRSSDVSSHPLLLRITTMGMPGVFLHHFFTAKILWLGATQK